MSNLEKSLEIIRSLNFSHKREIDADREIELVQKQVLPEVESLALDSMRGKVSIASLVFEFIGLILSVFPAVFFGTLVAGGTTIFALILAFLTDRLVKMESYLTGTFVIPLGVIGWVVGIIGFVATYMILGTAAGMMTSFFARAGKVRNSFVAGFFGAASGIIAYMVFYRWFVTVPINWIPEGIVRIAATKAFGGGIIGWICTAIGFGITFTGGYFAGVGKLTETMFCETCKKWMKPTYLPRVNLEEALRFKAAMDRENLIDVVELLQSKGGGSDEAVGLLSMEYCTLCGCGFVEMHLWLKEKYLSTQKTHAKTDQQEKAVVDKSSWWLAGSWKIDKEKIKMLMPLKLEKPPGVPEGKWTRGNKDESNHTV